MKSILRNDYYTSNVKSPRENNLSPPLDPFSLPEIIQSRLIPLDGKRPLVRTTWLKGPISKNQLRAWHFKFQTNSWGVLTGNRSKNYWLYVLDVDRPDLFRFIIPSHYYVLTGKGCHHYFFVKEELPFNHGEILINDQHAGDLICHPNNYVVAPYSLHANGNFYKPSESFLQTGEICFTHPKQVKITLGYVKIRVFRNVVKLNAPDPTRHSQSAGNVPDPTRHSQSAGNVPDPTRHSQSAGNVPDPTRHSQSAGNVPDPTRHSQSAGNTACSRRVYRKWDSETALGAGNRNNVFFRKVWNFAKWYKGIDTLSEDCFTRICQDYVIEQYHSLENKRDFPKEEVKKIAFYVARYLKTHKHKRVPANWSKKQRFTPKNSRDMQKRGREKVRCKNKHRDKRIKELSDSGMSVRDIGTEIGVSKSTVARVLAGK